MNSPKAIELKLKLSETATKLSNLELIKRIKDTMNDCREFEINSQTDLVSLSELLTTTFDCEVRSGVSGGCYGARDGKSYQGLTVYMSLGEFDDRFIDADGDEVVNFWYLFHENSNLLKSDIDDDFIDQVESFFDLKLESNNSYNYLDEVQALTNIHYQYYQRPDQSVVAFVRFHCGGDVRGNYTSYYAFEFDSLDDLYQAIYPLNNK